MVKKRASVPHRVRHTDSVVAWEQLLKPGETVKFVADYTVTYPREVAVHALPKRLSRKFGYPPRRRRMKAETWAGTVSSPQVVVSVVPG